MKNKKNTKGMGNYLRHSRHAKAAFVVTYHLTWKRKVIYIFVRYNSNGYYIGTDLSIWYGKCEHCTYCNIAIAVKSMINKYKLCGIYTEFAGGKRNTPHITVNTGLLKTYIDVSQTHSLWYNSNVHGCKIMSYIDKILN